MKRLFLFLAPWLVFVLLIVAVIIAMGTRAHGQFGVEQPMFAMQSSVPTNPPAIPTGDLFVWLKPESLIGAEGVGVTNWPDSSGWNHYVTNIDSSQQQPYITNNIANGYSGARFFDGNFSWLQFGPNNGQDFFKNQNGATLHFVIRPLDDANSLWFHAESTNVDNIRLKLSRDTGGTSAQIGVSGRAPDSQALQTYFDTRRLLAGANFDLWSYVFWFTNATMQFYKNGVFQFTKTSFIGPSATQNAADIVSIGYDGASGMEFQMPEFIGYTNAQDAVGLSNVFRYIGNKYFNANTNFLLSSYDVNALGLNDGDAISSLPDDGPGNYDLGMTSAAFRPYWSNNVSVINNNGFAVFDGSNDLLTNGFTASYPQPNHVFLVSSFVDDLAEYSIAFASINQLMFANVGDAALLLYAGTTITGPVIPSAQWIVWDFCFNGATSYVKSNNVTMLTGDSGTGAFSRIYLGNNSALSGAFKGGIACALVYTNDLNYMGASQIVTNLGTRFGITVYDRN